LAWDDRGPLRLAFDDYHSIEEAKRMGIRSCSTIILRTLSRHDRRSAAGGRAHLVVILPHITTDRHNLQIYLPDLSQTTPPNRPKFGQLHAEIGPEATSGAIASALDAAGPG
jgi:hypothetical protein